MKSIRTMLALVLITLTGLALAEPTGGVIGIPRHTSASASYSGL